MKRKLFIAAAMCLAAGMVGTQALAQTPLKPFSIIPAEDFAVTGDGSNPNWEKAAWLDMGPRNPSSEKSFSTRVKALYSPTGIYFLFDCEDTELSSAMDADFLDLWTEDVVEVFLMPDENDPVYFEYEISPLNYELVLIISNLDGDLTRWQPFHYDADRKTAHETSVTGGEKKPYTPITGWKAEFYIPYKLLRPLNSFIPKKGDRWKANFYRVDRNSDGVGSGSWSWQVPRGNFHDYKSFGTLVFE